ncbi:MAG TPA: (5-formylfuran-3-yl)methyl phosphate synthase [Pirellulales bacterium]|nr:(5-formylfuran-3-yl)methyl phosphate synthase [Pirellulales bacterium]
MTKLLVSVRDAGEARLALAAGVDLIDVKEPLAGALGPAAPAVVAEIAAAVGGARPLSVALGELDDFDAARVPRVPGIAFAKLGLAHGAGRCDWPGRWQGAIAALPAGTAPVAVVYADHARARSPAFRPILTQAVRLGCRAVLVDTFDKGAGGIFDHWSADAVREFIDKTQAAGLMAVVGGGLTLESIERLLPLAPDYVAVRGAACGADRTASISPERLAALVALVATSESARFSH